jgi:hypothetical protein
MISKIDANRRWRSDGSDGPVKAPQAPIKEIDWDDDRYWIPLR